MKIIIRFRFRRSGYYGTGSTAGSLKTTLNLLKRGRILKLSPIIQFRVDCCREWASWNHNLTSRDERAGSKSEEEEGGEYRNHDEKSKDSRFLWTLSELRWRRGERNRGVWGREKKIERMVMRIWRGVFKQSSLKHMLQSKWNSLFRRAVGKIEFILLEITATPLPRFRSQW